MHVEVDQSGKIEDTVTDTVIAFSNGKQFSILISSQVKKMCIRELRDKGMTGKSMYWLLFTAALYFLLKDSIHKNVIVIIDKEYIGHEAKIKEHLLNLLRRANNFVHSDQIQFDLIHRKYQKGNPMAHNTAYLTKQKKIRPNIILKAEDLLSQIKIKKDRGPKWGNI